MEPAPRRHPAVVGTVIALVALFAAVGAAVAWTAVADDEDDEARAEPELDLRLDGEDADAQPLVGDDVTGRPVPDAEFTMLDGTSASLADYDGRPLVVNFFASWCVPCREEMPAFEEVHDDLGDRVAFVGIALRDSVRDATAIVEETGVSYDIGRDPTGRLFAQLDGINMPSTFLVSAGGRIVAAEAGALDAGELRELIDDELLS